MEMYDVKTMPGGQHTIKILSAAKLLPSLEVPEPGATFIYRINSSTEFVESFALLD